MTLLVRNEADIIDAQIAFHLNAGVDFIIAIDNGSEDGTTEILERYTRGGYLHAVHRPDRHFWQVDWVTEMARLAATTFDADWVINSDGDEFWWPRGGTLKEVLAHVPSRFGTVRGMMRHFVPRPSADEFFAEQMTVRLCRPVIHRQHVFNPHFKTIHRADPEVTVGGGNHDASGRGLQPILGWYPIDVLHFPLRSLEQCERKYVQQYEVRRGLGVDEYMRDAYHASRESRMREFYESEFVDDRALAKGLEDGVLEIDTRLRDALRALRLDSPGGNPRFRTPSTDIRLGFDAPVDQGYLSELATLEDFSPLVRIQRRTEAAEGRLSALEQSRLARLRARLVGRRSDPASQRR
jgi:hypothetical protein